MIMDMVNSARDPPLTPHAQLHFEKCKGNSMGEK